MVLKDGQGRDREDSRVSEVSVVAGSDDYATGLPLEAVLELVAHAVRMLQ